ncbi:MAG: GMC family oxidoreductase [Anaerolineae bacterium]|nr:GMC family oxidoreductase [Anaerolineae bacterium]
MTELSETVDVCIVGVGACGGLMAKELAEAGFSVVGLEAGPRYNPKVDFENDEAEMLKLLWSGQRVTSGQDPIHPWSGSGVGGGTLVWCGVTPRFHVNDFRTASVDGVGVDWPLTYADLAPYYEQVECDFGVSGQVGENPWEAPRGPFPMPPLPFSYQAQVLARGVEKLGGHPLHGPLAIASVPYRGREACINCGFCMQGCRSSAKSTTLFTHVPLAEACGARILSESTVFRIEYDARHNKVTGVSYFDAQGQTHQIRARLIIVAAHAIETPRLLLLSANSTFPEGLANSSGLVGKNFMAHPTCTVTGLFHEPLNGFKGPVMGNLLAQDWYETDTRRGFARGYTLENFVPGPFFYASNMMNLWGAELKEMLCYYAYAGGWWVCGEGLPNDDNTVTLDPEAKDKRGLPVAHLQHSWTDNDRALIKHGIQKATETLEAAGAWRVQAGPVSSAHPMGTVRMGHDPQTSVINSFCQSHDIPNLFVTDTSVFPSGGGANVTLTAMAVTLRASRYIIEQVKLGNLN